MRILQLLIVKAFTSFKHRKEELLMPADAIGK